VIKQWILPTGNNFIKDPSRKFMRPEENPGDGVAYVQPDSMTVHGNRSICRMIGRLKARSIIPVAAAWDDYPPQAWAVSEEARNSGEPIPVNPFSRCGRRDVLLDGLVETAGWLVAGLTVMRRGAWT